ncbi:MAG: DNA-3-methyladenine glycosylase I [Phycisphaerales bacterium]|nr:DNA-3-methyladenine glycosylase I [Phycisphaerales bacterium]MCB9857659.1 DNA-3-methyladenine glycosylase I [Phycisphaerales bacterium]
MAARKHEPKDGKPRCAWASKDALQAAYHDREWGRPIRTDAGHLRRIAQEIFQCGLSWHIVLVKTPALKDVFYDFDVDRVSQMKSSDVDRLMKDERIIRNRRKIEATIHNANVFREIADEHGTYCKWFNRLPAATPTEIAALYPLFKKTFKFMGPETTKCYLMGAGKIPRAHEPGCWMAT